MSAPGLESEAAFRRRVREWVQRHLVDDARRLLSHEERRANTMAMFDAGLLHVTWPAEYGGRELPGAYQTIVTEETAAVSAALLSPIVTVGICARTLLDVGTDDQKRRHVPRMLRGEEFWTQLLSEPGAGSDLASVSTIAQQDGDSFVIDGQKVWTSGAMEADHALALVRTDRQQGRHRGLSMLILDLSVSGVDVRPLRDMTGSAVFNEVFLDHVVVSLDNLVGELNGGWSVLTRMLTHERFALGLGTAGVRMDSDAFADLLQAARTRGLLADPIVRRTITDVYIEQRLLALLGVRIRQVVEAGVATGPLGSLGKIGTARAARAAAEAGLAVRGLSGQAWAPDDEDTRRFVESFLSFPKNGIAGGTTEIQKNIVAERLLGLPREPVAARD